MNNQQKQSIGENIIPKNLQQISQNSVNSLNKKLKTILTSGTLPEEALTDFQITFLLNHLSALDTNNFQGKIGVGEREARVFSQFIKNRYSNLLHGMGRSGELTAIQPKAPGSSILQIATHRLLKNTLKKMGIGGVKKCLILPVATGMAITLSLLYLRQIQPDKKKVVFLRIDQKSCFKSIITAGFEPIVVQNETKQNQDEEIFGLTTNLKDLESVLQKDNKIIAVLSNSSCFAPKEPDDLIQIGKLCRFYNVYHVVNNAYGLQSSKTINTLNEANSQNLLDIVIQSTDKNFFVPVGGSIIFSTNKKLIEGIDKNYPGRCSINSVLDLFVSLLSLGSNKLLELLKKRQQNYVYLKEQLILIAEQLNEKVIVNQRNDISIAFTLKNLKENSKDLGSYLFNQNVMGARVVTRSEELKEVNGYEFENFGGHINGNYKGFPYITIACAVGTKKKELEKFLKIFQKLYKKLAKNNQLQWKNQQIQKKIYLNQW